MGNVTTEFQIWTPDDENAVEPDVYLSQMANSIEEGMGKRVLKQEQQAYLRTQINGPITLDDHDLVRVPIYKVDGEGINLNANIVEIVTDGLYFLAPTIETSFANNHAIDYVLRLNGDALEERHAVTSTKAFTSMNITIVSPLFQGDKLWLEARIGNPGGEPADATILMREARFHMAMLYAF